MSLLSFYIFLWRRFYILLESGFKTRLIHEIEDLFPGCIIFHLDPNEIQGAPDLLILFRDTWAALEGKKNREARHQPNQDYYIDLMDKMSFARFICPENKREVLYELQQAFRVRRPTCSSRR